jgi:predicted aspartyl protease
MGPQTLTKVQFMKVLCKASLIVSLFASMSWVNAADFDIKVPMRDKGARTYYVGAQIAGVGSTELMVDTGSGYLTINEDTLQTLLKQEKAQYVKQLTGILADGTEMKVPVYRLTSLNLGNTCTLTNVEAAVFPGKTRQILGLSALSKAAPFIFSIDPPQLVLSNCDGSPT